MFRSLSFRRAMTTAIATVAVAAPMVAVAPPTFAADPAYITIAVSPVAQIHPVGDTYELEVFVSRDGGQGLAGFGVVVSVSGANPSAGIVYTDAIGQATYSYVGVTPGVDVVTARASSPSTPAEYGAVGTGTVQWTTPGAFTGWPSDGCDQGTNVVSGYVGIAYVKVRELSGLPADPDATVVCIVAEPLYHLGGRLTLTGAGAGTVSTVDDGTAASAACAAQPHNVRVQSGTLLGGQPYWVDVTPAPFASGDATWVCLRVTDAVALRIRFGTGVLAAFTPDTIYGHYPDYPPPSWPAGVAAPTCAAAANAVRYVDLAVGEGNQPVSLYSWNESATRAHVCYRGGGSAGRFTVDTTATPGVSPLVTVTNTATACPFAVITRDQAPTYGVYTSNPATLPNPPASACVSVGGTTTGVSVGATGPATVTWAP